MPFPLDRHRRGEVSKRPASSNIGPDSLLHACNRRAPEDHEALHAPMTLAAAWGSLYDGSYPYHPVLTDAIVCGCGRCT